MIFQKEQNHLKIKSIGILNKKMKHNQMKNKLIFLVNQQLVNVYNFILEYFNPKTVENYDNEDIF